MGINKGVAVEDNERISTVPKNYDRSWQPAISTIPTQPGVYKYRDANQRVIYVGKAKNLRNRLSSYFVDISQLHTRTAHMILQARSVEWTVVNTEVEALQLEYNWIKEFNPRFNVRFKDDKSYPYLQVTTRDLFPRMSSYRGEKKKNIRYFGPYSHAWAARETLDLLITAFPIRTCTNTVFNRHKALNRPCLLGHIDKCCAPCVGRTEPDEYRVMVNQACAFLAGKTDVFLQSISHRMYQAAEAQEFEKAAKLRDSLMALEKTIEKQHVVLQHDTDADFISIYVDDIDCSVEVFTVRKGRVRGQLNRIFTRPVVTDNRPVVTENRPVVTENDVILEESDSLTDLMGDDGLSLRQNTLPRQVDMNMFRTQHAVIESAELAQILTDFIVQYYPQLVEHERTMNTPRQRHNEDDGATGEIAVGDGTDCTDVIPPEAASDWSQTQLSPIPHHIYLPVTGPEQNSLEELLSSLRGSKVHLHVPQRGEKKNLLDTVTLNARQHLERSVVGRLHDITSRSQALNELAQYLGLEQAPFHMECIDISHLQGTNVVASLVVFEDGLPQKSQYKRYNIKYSAGAGHSDDVGSIKEITRRRFLRIGDAADSSSESDDSFTKIPQLFIVDGGQPQVNAAYSVLVELGLSHIPVVGIAKRLEQIWFPYTDYPCILPRNSSALFLLQHIRDEAHRFAINFHRHQRKKSAIVSVLDQISGIGPQRKRNLIKHFGSLKHLQEASLEEIEQVTGISKSIAESVYNFLHS